MKLSVVVPFYNERYLLRAVLERVLAQAPPGVDELEVLLIDDGSTDGSSEIAREIAAAHTRVRYLRQEPNAGKGAALRRGVAETTGDIVLVQDADLEYDPSDYAALLRPFVEGGADAVYGSRFLAGSYRRVLYFHHSVGNRFLTLMSNLLTNLNLTDVESCYKAVRGPLIRSIPLRSNSFTIEIELTAKLAKRGCRIFEVPIRYSGRTYQEGKKIGWLDGFRALGAMVKYKIIDDLYTDDRIGAQILRRLERVRRFNGWMADGIRPFLGQSVLEIGAGIGNMTLALIPRDRYLATDLDESYVEYLETLRPGRPYLRAARVDAEDSGDFADLREVFDTVVCLNVLEHVRDPARTLRNLGSALQPQGRLLLYVPQGQWLYSRLDEVLEHRCRYSRRQLLREVVDAGFEIETVRQFNKASVPGWWLNGKLLGRTRPGRIQLKLFDWTVPLLRHVDSWLPWPGLGLLLVARKPSS